ncbi:MAG: 30S ribosome-binding factor RbfA [Actinomycetia bacterium]|nr:30S ribosome-binding factor RbfA [Actinomycetes bacterium]
MTETDARARRLAERIQVIVAETIERRVKDPRMGFVTITDVRVTRDLREATVFYTVLGDPTEQSDTGEALESAKGMLRTEVGRQTGIRHTPSLAFIADAIPETARHLDDLLRAARAADERVHEQAVAATYAGEADPYRHEDELDERGPEVAGHEVGRLDEAGLDEAGGASA